MGGSATAFFLSQMGSVKDSKVQIDLIEQADRIGGRVYALPFRGSKYEAGGSILHSSNQYAGSLSHQFGLLHRADDDIGSHLMGIFDGEDFVFKESSYSLVTMFRIIQRYGMDALRMQSLVNSMLHHFSRIYVYQKKGTAFKELKQMLAAMSYKFPDLLHHSFYENLRNMSFSDVTINELVQAISMVNYGQPVRGLHAFVGAVSSAGADFSGSLWSIDGGNERLPQELAKRSGARLFLMTQVLEVELLPNGTYIVRDANANEMSHDAIVIAHPLSLSGIQFRGFTDGDMEIISAEKKMGKYHRTVASFVSGVRSTNYTSGDLEDVIVCKDNFFFQSISRLSPASSRMQPTDHPVAPDVYKIFSPNPLTPQQLATLFDKIQDVHVIPWDAYPQYYQIQAQNPKFELRKGLYYINAIEWAASAMEMSLISAKNAALLTNQFLS